MSLQLALIPGVDRLIDWYTNEGVLLAELQSLALYSVESPSGFDVRTCCNGIQSMVHGCAGTLKDLVWFSFTHILSEPAEHTMGGRGLRSLRPSTTTNG